MRNLITFMSITTLFFMMLSCNSYGDYKNFDGLKIYYSEGMNLEKVDDFGNYLVASKFTDGSEKTVKLEFVDNMYKLKMVILPDFIESPEYAEELISFGNLLNKDVFSDSLSCFHLCDAYFEIVKTLKLDADK